jgi:hypothetical protein
VHIAEPKVENSGITQGVFVKRHRVPKADNELINLDDLRIGNDLMVYGRKFHLYDCDDFSRSFFDESGVGLGGSEECPSDAFTKKNTVELTSFKKLMYPEKEFNEALAGKQMGIDIKGTQQFLKYDQKVLRFFCVWHDTMMYGESKPLIVHYYLADDTVEVMEVMENNSGRDAFPTLCTRGKLPMKYQELSSDLTSIGQNGHNPKVQFYNEKDLKIGGTINVYGRELRLLACDEFTKKFYMSNFGMTENDFPALQDDSPISDAPRVQPPPYTGYGSEADSLGSFLYLIPKIPKEDFKKIVENDGLNLRWMCKLSNPSPEDRKREFVLTYYMADDTIALFEKFQRNSGFVGGKFSERKAFKNPRTGAYFTPHDMTPNTTIEVNHFKFDIYFPDGFTEKFISNNPTRFTTPPAEKEWETIN